jgi:hypothetical protein
MTQSVKRTSEAAIYKLITSPFGVILTLILIVVRLFVGKVILETVNVIWVTDALYLFFIGISYAKWKGMVRQIDEDVYVYMTKMEKEKKMGSDG